MIVKKSGGKVIGAHLTAAEQKALDIEIQKQLEAFERKNLMEVDAIMLWWLHEKLGFGAKRLKDFYKDFHDAFYGMLNHYEMENTEGTWLCTQKLKEIGVDLEAWYREDEASRQGDA